MRIIRVTRWYRDYGCERPMLRKGEYIFGQLYEEGAHFDVIPTPCAKAFIDKMGDNVTSLRLIRGEDKWVELKEDAWPDEVCTYFAVKALTEGEK